MDTYRVEVLFNDGVKSFLSWDVPEKDVDTLVMAFDARRPVTINAHNSRSVILPENIMYVTFKKVQPTPWDKK